MRIHTLAKCYVVAVGLIAASAAGAQTRDTTCTYDRCALAIVPRLTALKVVRGRTESPVISLPFLWPRDVSTAFVADSEALRRAGAATRLRRVGAALTTAGAAAALVGVARSVSHGGRIYGRTATLLGGGTALVGASVPVQFAADRELSRAVWYYNRSLPAITDARRPNN